MRIKKKVIIDIARDTAMKNLMFSIDDTLAEKVTDGYTKEVDGILSIAATQQESLSFGDITAVKGLFLELDGDAIININGSTDDIQLRAIEGTAKFLIEADISSLAITAGATALNGVWCAWGDATS